MRPPGAPQISISPVKRPKRKPLPVRHSSGVPPPPSDWEGWSDPEYSSPRDPKVTWSQFCRPSFQRTRFLTFLSNLYGLLGASIEAQPWTTIVLSILATCVFIPGILKLKWTTDPNMLWVPQDTTYHSHYVYGTKEFQTKNDRDIIVILRSKIKGVNLLTPSMQETILDVHENIVSSIKGGFLKERWPVLPEPVGYEDVCKKTSGDCWDPNYLGTYDYNSSIIPDNDQEVVGTIHQWISAGTPTEAVFGGGIYQGSLMVSAESVRLKYTTQGEKYSLFAPVNYYEKALEETLHGLELEQKHPEIEVEVLTEYGRDTEILMMVETDWTLLPVAMSCVVCWLAVSLGGFDLVNFKGFLCLSVIIEVVCCCVMSFGMMGYLGFKGSTLNLVMPFIVVGVSVDDVIVVEEFYYKTRDKKVDRMMHCLALAGPAITTTSLTSVLAFFSSATLDIPGVRSFCTCCGFAFLWDLILNVSLFPALVVLDERRIEWAGAWFFPWWKVKEEWRESQISVTLEVRKGFDNFKSNRNLAEKRLSDVSVQSQGTADTGVSTRSIREKFSHQHFLDMKSTRKVLKQKNRKGSLGSAGTLSSIKVKIQTSETLWSVENLMVNYFAPFLQLEYIQCIVLVLFTILALAGGTLSIYTAKGVGPEAFVREGNNAWNFIEENKRLYPSDFSLLAITITNLDYTNREEVTKLSKFFSYLESYEGTDGQVGGAGGSWYQHYAMYLNAKGKDAYIEFPKYLDEFVKGSHGSLFEHDIVCAVGKVSVDGEEDETECTAVKASKYYIWMKGKGSGDEYRDYIHLNGILKEHGLSEGSFVFKLSYLHSATAEIMSSYMLNSLALTILILFVTMILFTDTVSCVFITLMVVFVDCDLLGIMYLWGINISPVSFVCVIMSSGLSIDYCVHIGHAFTHSHGVNPNVRMGEAVKMMGTSVLKGGMTTFLGTIPLAFASSSAFTTFFKLMFCTVILGILHGLVALPVFLATYYNLTGGAGNEKVEVNKVLGSTLAQGARTKNEVDASRKKGGGVIMKNKMGTKDFLKSASSGIFFDFGLNPMRAAKVKGERMKKLPPMGKGDEEDGRL